MSLEWIDWYFETNCCSLIIERVYKIYFWLLAAYAINLFTTCFNKFLDSHL